MVSPDQKCHVATGFNHLDLQNTVVPLVVLPTSVMLTPMHWHDMIETSMQVVSCDASVDVNGITRPKKSCCISFQLSQHKECNIAVPLIILLE